MKRVETKTSRERDKFKSYRTCLDAFEVITSSWTLDQLQSLRNERNELTSESVSAFSNLLSKDRDEKVNCVLHVVQVSSRVRLGICINFSIIRAVSENMNVLVAAAMSRYLSYKLSFPTV